MRRFDLRSLKFGDASEAWRRLPVDVAPFVFGGIEYAVPGDAVDLLLTAARVGDRLTLTAEFETDVSGPCQRCLAEATRACGAARPRLRAARRFGGYRRGRRPTPTTSRWTSSAGSATSSPTALPQQMLCRDDCRGLCVVCGADLNADPRAQPRTAEAASDTTSMVQCRVWSTREEYTHACSQEKNVAVASATAGAPSRSSASRRRERMSAVQEPQASAPRLPELRHL